MKRRIQNRPEEALHRAVAQLLDAALPPDAVWCHVPNGGARSKAEAGILKALGVKPGWPDIQIIWRKRVIMIELKPAKGYLSEAQKTMHGRLILAGAIVATCRSVEGVSAFLDTVMGTDWRASIGDAA